MEKFESEKKIPANMAAQVEIFTGKQPFSGKKEKAKHPRTTASFIFQDRHGRE